MVILLNILHTIYFAEGRLLNVNAISKEVSPVQSEPAMFIADVIRSFDWTSLCILHDTSSEYTVSSLHSAMASKTPSCTIMDFNIDETDVNDVLKTVNVIMSPSINIVLVCKPRGALYTLKMANIYDSSSNRTTDYRHLSKWIVLTERRTLLDIHQLALDLENVIFVSPRPQDKEGVVVSTLQGTGTAGRLVPVTSFRMTEAFPNMKYGFNNRTLLVSMMKRAYLNDVLMTMANVMAQKLNFSIQVIEPPDKAWGNEDNGTWNGLIGQLQKREVDMVASGLTISEDRAAVMDYLLPPFTTAYTRVMYREPDVDQYKWLLLLKPFKQMVFVVFGVCVVCVLLIYGVTELHLRHGTPGDTLKTKKEILSNVSWFILGSMLKQGSTYTFTGVSGRVLTFFWWIFLIVITSVYTAKLVAFLSVKKSQPPPFNNLQELSERLDYSIGFPTEGFARTYFQNSKREDIKQLWKMVQQQHVTDPRVFSTDYNYHVNEMKKRKYAAIVSTITSDVLMAKNCKLAYLRDWALYEQMAFGVPKSSPLKSELERVMHMLVDTGWPGKWMDDFGFLVDKTGCDSEKLVTPVTLDEVGGVGTAVAAGVGLALLTLALECLYHYCIGSQYGNET